MTLILSPQLRPRAAFAALALSLIYLGLGAPVGARAQQAPASEYALLKGKQKTLFDEWARQKNTRARASPSPAERYAAMSVS